MAARSQSDPGCRAAGGTDGPRVPASQPSPARPTPGLVLGPGPQLAVRALPLVPWPVGPSAAPAPCQAGPGGLGLGDPL